MCLLVWKMFPHPVGVFCTHLEPPKSHIRKNICVPKIIYLLYCCPTDPWVLPSGEISALEGEIKASNSDMADLLKFRNEEEADFKQALKDDSDAALAVKT